MAPSEVERRVCGAIEICFGLSPGEVTRALAREQIAGWDSVGHLNLMLVLEDTFAVRMSLEDMQRLTSVDAIVGFFEE